MLYTEVCVEITNLKFYFSLKTYFLGQYYSLIEYKGRHVNNLNIYL